MALQEKPTPVSALQKLSPYFLGPFIVLRQVNHVSFTLSLPAHVRISPTCHVSLFRPVVPGPLTVPAACADPPGPITGSCVRQGGCSTWWKLLGSRCRGGTVTCLAALVEIVGFQMQGGYCDTLSSPCLYCSEVLISLL